MAKQGWPETRYVVKVGRSVACSSELAGLDVRLGWLRAGPWSSSLSKGSGFLVSESRVLLAQLVSWPRGFRWSMYASSSSAVGQRLPPRARRGSEGDERGGQAVYDIRRASTRRDDIA